MVLLLQMLNIVIFNTVFVLLFILKHYFSITTVLYIILISCFVIILSHCYYHYMIFPSVWTKIQHELLLQSEHIHCVIVEPQRLKLLHVHASCPPTKYYLYHCCVITHNCSLYWPHAPAIAPLVPKLLPRYNLPVSLKLAACACYRPAMMRLTLSPFSRFPGTSNGCLTA